MLVDLDPETLGVAGGARAAVGLVDDRGVRFVPGSTQARDDVLEGVVGLERELDRRLASWVVGVLRVGCSLVARDDSGVLGFLAGSVESFHPADRVQAAKIVLVTGTIGAARGFWERRPFVASRGRTLRVRRRN